jgi:hypothetical protein
MGNQTGGAFEELSIFVSEGVHLAALGIEHADDVFMTVRHRHDNLRARGVKRRQIPRVFAHIAHDDRFARFQNRAAKSLRDRESRIGRRFVPGVGHDGKFLFRNFVNADPPVVAGRTDHLRHLLDAALRTTARQNERPDRLQVFARGRLHHAGDQSGSKENKREQDFNYLNQSFAATPRHQTN